MWTKEESEREMIMMKKNTVELSTTSLKKTKNKAQGKHVMK